MIPDAYVWLAWSSAFLVPWIVLYLAFPAHRKAMLWSSLFTMPLGLSEPLFVPAYWNPPSLFGLAQSTGFDIESLIFCFGIGGVGAVLTNIVSRRRLEPVPAPERCEHRHRYHLLALASPFLAFPALYWLPWNPIYAAIGAMLVGALATMACRPDLTRTTQAGAAVFFFLYTGFLAGLELTAPGYIDRVWNLEALSGWQLLGLPVEELLFAVSFGAYWSGLYEHFTWRRAKTPRATDDSRSSRDEPLTALS